jgi:hypothetical protein
MGTLEKPPELAVEQILAKANRRLPYELQVRPDDPIMGVLAINEELLNAYLAAVKQALREAQLESATLSQQAAKIAEEQAKELLEKFDDHLNKRIQNWEKQFKTQSEKELFKIRAAALYSQIGGALILAAGALATGIAIGNLIFH